MKARNDVLVIGAGAAGLSAAFHLAKEGCKVAVIEREVLPGSHASGKNAGMIRHLQRHPRLIEWVARSVCGWPENLRKHFVASGSLITGIDVPTAWKFLFRPTVVSEGDSSIPAVSTDADGLLDSPAYMNELVSDARRAGVEIHCREKVENIRIGRHNLIIESSSRNFLSALVVNAAGAWTNEVLPANLHMPLAPFERHLFLVTGFPKDFMPHGPYGFYWNETTRWYLRRWDEYSRIVSICDRSPMGRSTSGAALEALAKVLTSSLPAVAPNLRVQKYWACARTCSQDELPIVGFDPRVPRLFWLAAFGGFGMSTSFAAGEDCARAICGRAAPLPSEFSPERFL